MNTIYLCGLKKDRFLMFCSKSNKIKFEGKTNMAVSFRRIIMNVQKTFIEVKEMVTCQDILKNVNQAYNNSATI